MSKSTHIIAAFILSLSACGGGEDNNTTANNTTANNTTPNNVAPNNVAPNNVAPNNVAPNNVAPNNVAPNNVAPNNAMPGGVTVDFAVNVNGRMTQITNCDELGTSGWTESGQDVTSGVPFGRLNCAIAEEGSFTAFYIVDIWFYEGAVGTNQAADVDLSCGAGGCDGIAEISVRYQDGAAGILDESTVSNAETSMGSFTVDSFDTATGATAGSVDLSWTEDGQDFALTGTFSGTLAGCRSAGCM